MKDHSTQNRYDIAEELSVPNELIGSIRQYGDILVFDVNGRDYAARLTKHGHIKRHSVRLY